MATARLADDEKNRIVNTIQATTARALFNKEFPVAKKDATEWITNQLPKAHRKAYLLLKQEEPELVTRQNYACDFKIQSTTHQYQIGIEAAVPRNHIMVQPSDSYHADVIKWIEWETDIKDKVNAAQNYISDLVYCCTSAGQLKRLLPQEIMRFIPDYLLDFSEVERRSRIPASFNPDPDRLEAMMNILTVGSISPEQRKGLKCWSEHVAPMPATET